MEGCAAHEAKRSEGSTGQRGGEGLPWGSGGTARERGSGPARWGGSVEIGMATTDESPCSRGLLRTRHEPLRSL